MSLRTNILASWTAHLIMIAIGIVMLPYVRNTLEPGAYGAWLFINMIAGYAGLLYMGFGSTVCRYVAKHLAVKEWDELNSVTSTIMAVYSTMAGLTILFSIGFAVAAPWIDRWGTLSLQEIQAVILLNGLSTAVGMVGSVFGGVLIGSQRIGLKRFIEVACGLLRFILAIGCLRIRPELTTLSVLFLGVTVVENLLLYHYACRAVPELEIHRRHVSRRTLRECFTFSGYNAIGQTAEQIIHLTDTTVVGFAKGIAFVDIFYIGQRICQMIQEPFARIGDVVLPRAGQLHTQSRQKELVQVVERMIALTFVLVAGFFIGAWYFGGLLIRLWIGPGLEQSHRILLILLAAQIVAQPMLMLRQTLRGMGQVRTQALIDILEAALNLILSVILVFQWGIEGVAWGTLIPLYLVELLIFLPYACREIGLRKRHLFLHAVAPSLLPLTALWGYCDWVARQGYSDRVLTLLSVTICGGTVLMVTAAPVYWWMNRLDRHPGSLIASTDVGGVSG